MKLAIDKNQLNMSPEQFLRRAGYGYIRDRRTGHDSYVRRLGSGFYPRLHMYIEEQGGRAIFNLHLDQKQASYEGAHMHNAEYDGPVVEGEMARLKSLVSDSAQQNNAPASTGNSDLLGSISKNASFGRNIQSTPKPKSWWRFWQKS